MATLKKINGWMHRALMLIAQISLAAMTIMVFVTVVMRFFFNRGNTLAEEVPRLLVTLVAFVAMGMGVRDRTHISADIIYNRFPKGGRVQRALDLLSTLLVFICGIFMLYFGMQRILNQARVAGVLPATGLPIWVQFVPIPLCGLMIVFDSVLFLLGVIKPGELFYADPETDDAIEGTEPHNEKEKEAKA